MIYLQADGEHMELKHHNVGGEIPGFRVNSIEEQISALLVGCVTLGG